MWDDMKAIYGRQYVTEEDLQKYKVKFEGGIIRFMDDIDADTSEEGASL